MESMFILKELTEIESNMADFLLKTGQKKSNKEEFNLYIQVSKARKNIAEHLSAIKTGKNIRILCKNGIISWPKN